MDSDSEYEETSYLVYADFKNQLTPQQLKHEDAAIKVIGIECNSPMAEINGNIFKGTYEVAMGTNLFFQKDKNTVLGDPLFDNTSKHHYKYVAKSNEVISFERIYVEQLPQDQEKVIKTEIKDLEPNMQILKLDVNYMNAIETFGSEE